MKSYRFIRPGLTASLLFAPLFGCSESTPIDAPLTDEGRLAIDVAPLAFPGTTFDAIVDAQYDIVVKYSDPSAVGGWSTLTTVNDIKSSDFDNPGGALSYVAPCAVDDGVLGRAALPEVRPATQRGCRRIRSTGLRRRGNGRTVLSCCCRPQLQGLLLEKG